MAAFRQSFLREVRHLRRCRWDLAMSTLLPLTLMILMAVLFLPGSPRNLAITVVDQDGSAFSRRVIRMADASPELRVAGVRTNLAAAWPDVKAARVSGILLIPPRAGREVAAGRQAQLTLYPAAPYYTASVMIMRAGNALVRDLNAALVAGASARLNPRRAAALASPVAVQATTLFNPAVSYELMITTMLFPALLLILFSCAVMTSVGREFSEKTFSDWISGPGEVFPALAGKLAPYLILYLIYGAGGMIWTGLLRGYPVAGSMALLLLGYGLMFVAYGLLAAALGSVVHDAAVGLGSVAVYASSALTFSGAYFPMHGAVMFTQSWNMVQPFTWMSRLIAGLWQMGAGPAASVRPLSVLLLMCAVLAGLAWLGLSVAVRQRGRERAA